MMAKYYTRSFSIPEFYKPPTGPLVGLQLMKGSRVNPVYWAQDVAASLGCRVVLHAGLRGDSEWYVPSTDPAVFEGAQTHPDSTTWRPVARGRFEITPGCALRLSVLAIPSGETQVELIS